MRNGYSVEFSPLVARVARQKFGLILPVRKSPSDKNNSQGPIFGALETLSERIQTEPRCFGSRDIIPFCRACASPETSQDNVVKAFSRLYRSALNAPEEQRADSVDAALCLISVVGRRRSDHHELFSAIETTIPGWRAMVINWISCRDEATEGRKIMLEYLSKKITAEELLQFRQAKDPYIADWAVRALLRHDKAPLDPPSFTDPPEHPCSPALPETVRDSGVRLHNHSLGSSAFSRLSSSIPSRSVG